MIFCILISYPKHELQIPFHWKIKSLLLLCLWLSPTLMIYLFKFRAEFLLIHFDVGASNLFHLAIVINLGLSLFCNIVFTFSIKGIMVS
jgi:hypothetical protein